MGFVVAVDGAAGSGKGTITKKIAKEMNLTSIDTGAMYRSVTLAMLNKNIALDDFEKISELLDEENGIEMPYEEILESVKNRDFIDSTREIAPLKKADDAIYVDSSNMTIDEVVERIKKIISEKRK